MSVPHVYSLYRWDEEKLILLYGFGWSSPLAITFGVGVEFNLNSINKGKTYKIPIVSKVK